LPCLVSLDISRNRLRDFEQVFRLKEMNHLESLNIEGNPLPVQHMSRVVLIGLLTMRGLDRSEQSHTKMLNARYENVSGMILSAAETVKKPVLSKTQRED